MGLLNLFGAMSPVHISWVTLFGGGRLAGIDQAGNKYYRAKARRGYRRERRWVIYNGVPEATSVPPEWHGWLHHQTDQIPAGAAVSYRQPWQKPHQPNLTGTDRAYRPPGHVLSGGRRPDATGDYEAWAPDAPGADARQGPGAQDQDNAPPDAHGHGARGGRVS